MTPCTHPVGQPPLDSAPSVTIPVALEHHSNSTFASTTVPARSPVLEQPSSHAPAHFGFYAFSFPPDKCIFLTQKCIRSKSDANCSQCQEDAVLLLLALFSCELYQFLLVSL